MPGMGLAPELMFVTGFKTGAPMRTLGTLLLEPKSNPANEINRA